MNFDAFHPQIRAYIPELPKPTCTRLAARACEEFLRGSEYWRETITQDVLTQLDHEVTLTGFAAFAPTVHRIVSVMLDNREIKPRSEQAMDLGYPQWRTLPQTPYFFVPGRGAKFQLAPLPQIAITGGLEIHCALTTTQSSTALPDDVAIDNQLPLIDGILMHAYAMDDEPWFNERKATGHGLRFREGIAQALRRVENRRQSDGRTVAYGGY